VLARPTTFVASLKTFFSSFKSPVRSRKYCGSRIHSHSLESASDNGDGGDNYCGGDNPTPPEAFHPLHQPRVVSVPDAVAVDAVAAAAAAVVVVVVVVEVATVAYVIVVVAGSDEVVDVAAAVTVAFAGSAGSVAFVDDVERQQQRQRDHDPHPSTCLPRPLLPPRRRPYLLPHRPPLAPILICSEDARPSLVSHIRTRRRQAMGTH